MLKTDDYKKLLAFEKELSSFHFHPPANTLFTQHTLNLLDKIFGFSMSVAGFLPDTTKRTLTKAFVPHGIDRDRSGICTEVSYDIFRA